MWASSLQCVYGCIQQSVLVVVVRTHLTCVCVCMCACVRAYVCVRACVRACVCVCVHSCTRISYSSLCVLFLLCNTRDCVRSFMFAHNLLTFPDMRALFHSVTPETVRVCVRSCTRTTYSQLWYIHASFLLCNTRDCVCTQDMLLRDKFRKQKKFVEYKQQRSRVN